MYRRVPALNLVEDHVGRDTRWPRKPMYHAEEAVVDEWMKHAGAHMNDVVITCSHRRRIGAEFGGTEKTFADQNFRMTFFKEKISIFLVTDPICFCFCQSLLSEIWYITYMTYSSSEKPLFQKKNFYDTFFIQFLLSHASDNTISQNIWGMDRPPPQILEGTVPPVPPKSPPMRVAQDKKHASVNQR